MDESRFKLDDFELYRLAREFRKGIYQLIKRLPPEEKYCLVPQMRKAALSVSNNVAEGHGRWHFQDNIRFCLIARGSVDEVIDDLNVCLDEAYVPETDVLALKEQASTVIHKINSYIAYLRRSKQGSDLRPPSLKTI